MDEVTPRLKLLLDLCNTAWYWRRRHSSMTWSEELNHEYVELECELIQKARELVELVDNGG